MRFDSLKTFISVADSGSYTAASKKLYVSVTAIMKQIHTMEAYLGLQLFERSSSGVTLTAAGKSMYEDSKHILDIFERAVFRAKEIDKFERHDVNIGFYQRNSNDIFMNYWFKLFHDYPNLNINLITVENALNGDHLLTRELNKRFDFSIGIYDSYDKLENYDYLELCKYKMCCSFSRFHPLAKKEKINFSDLYGSTLMIIKPGISPVCDLIRREIENNHPQIRIENLSRLYDVEDLNLCSRTDKVITNVECYKEMHPALVTVPLEYEYYISYGLFWSKDASQDIKSFAEEIRAMKEEESK